MSRTRWGAVWGPSVLWDASDWRLGAEGPMGSKCFDLELGMRAYGAHGVLGVASTEKAMRG